MSPQVAHDRRLEAACQQGCLLGYCGLAAPIQEAEVRAGGKLVEVVAGQDALATE